TMDTLGNRHFLGAIPSPVDSSRMRGRSVFARSLASFPSKFDLRTANPIKVTGVRDQNPLGTCWTFGAYGSMESCLLPNETWDFSEKNMKNLAGFDLDPNEGGGNLNMSTAYLARWDGPVAEADDPYSINPSSLYSPTGLTVRKHIQNILYLPGRTSPTDNNNIKQALQDYGAVSTTMCWDNGSYNANTNSFYFPGSAALNHAVTIVGWDDTYSRSKFWTTPPGDGAFIIKNSWGSGWGESGYFYISYYDTVLGYELNPVFPNVESPSNYGRIYQYDTLGMVDLFCTSTSGTGWFANVFTAQATETISAASWYTYLPGASYTLRVYTNPTGGPIGTGKLIANQSGTLNFPGYQTIKLTTPVPVTAGQKFSVVVRLTTVANDFQIPVEYPWSGYSSRATSAAGQSYVSDGGTSWSDITSSVYGANVCLKAFASGIPTTATPVISPNGGTFSDSQTVTLSCDTTDALIYYTKDGSMPTSTASSSCFAYSAPITLTATTTLNVRAFKTGLNPSDLATATFTKVVVSTGLIYFDSGLINDGNLAIHRMKPDGSNRAAVTTNGGWIDGFPSVTGDGQTIVFASDRDGGATRWSTVQIYKMNTDGSGQTRLSTDATYVDAMPAVSQDGQVIAFLSNRDHYGEADSNGYIICDLYTMDINGGNVKRITTTTNGVQFGTFAINPGNHDQIVFIADLDGNGAKLYLVNALTKALTSVPVTVEEISTAAFNYDGTKILFSGWSSSVGYQVYQANLNGGSQTQLTHLETDGYYNVLPRANGTGDRIVFASDRDNIVGPYGYTLDQVYRMDVDGSNQLRLTQTATNESEPFWSDPQGASKVATLAFSPTPGTYAGSVAVTLICSTPGASIRYTKNGSTPTLATSSTCFAYNAPFTLTTTTTLKVKAFKTGLADSDMVSGTYTLTPATSRYIRLKDASGSPGTVVQVPIEMVCSGTENALGFSLKFDPTIITHGTAELGSDAMDASLNVNESQTSSGYIGITLALPAGQRFAAGTRQLVMLNLTIAGDAELLATPLAFSDTPVQREVSDVNADTLPANWANASLGIYNGFEADVTPRPTGKRNGTVSVTDMVLIGRFAAGLDTPASSEFARADCAPASTKGDGALSITDWVQAGRYAAGIDPVVTVGGPNGQQPATPARAGGLAGNRAAHQVYLSTPAALLPGQSGTMQVKLDAQGDETALGFSLNFDATRITVTSVKADSTGAAGASININDSKKTSGQIGVGLSLSAGHVFSAGTHSLVIVTFTVKSTLKTADIPVTFSDSPVLCELSDVQAESLEAAYNGAMLHVSHAPVAKAGKATILAGTPSPITLLATDVDGDALTYTVVSAPKHAQYSLGADGVLTVTADDFYHGADSLTFTASDGVWTSNVATVALTVTPHNHMPIADSQTVAALEGIAKTITLTGSDPDGDKLTYVIVSKPLHGKFTASGTKVTYTATVGYSGPDSFTFKVSDGKLYSDMATVTINVQHVNHAPTAVSQTVTTAEDVAKVIALTSVKDIDSADTLTLNVVKAPAHGSLTSYVGGAVIYTPNLHYAGRDSFSYTVSDNGDPSLTSPVVTVTITVTPVNDAPTATSQDESVMRNVAKVITLNVSDPDNTALTVTPVIKPSHGTVTFSGVKATYKPVKDFSGTDSFTYKVSDGKLTATATVTLTVLAP
ncbi:MAG TPA: Ig-like domain-containing protein, partial [Armatimonadota bacterium]